jgi:hypothetical protein
VKRHQNGVPWQDLVSVISNLWFLIREVLVARQTVGRELNEPRTRFCVCVSVSYFLTSLCLKFFQPALQDSFLPYSDPF